MKWNNILLLLITTSLLGCGTVNNLLNPVPLEENEGNKADKSFRGNEIIIATFNGATYEKMLSEASKNPLKSNDITLGYLQAGIALSDQICAEWFRRLGKAQSNTDLTRDLTSNIGALTATVLGLANTSSAVVGGVAGGFGFAEQSISSFQAHVIVAPDVSAVERLLSINRKELAFKMEKNVKNENFNFFKTRSLLTEYARSCSHLAVKQVVNESINKIAKIRKVATEKAASTSYKEISEAQINQALTELRKEGDDTTKQIELLITKANKLEGKLYSEKKDKHIVTETIHSLENLKTEVQEAITETNTASPSKSSIENVTIKLKKNIELLDKEAESLKTEAGNLNNADKDTITAGTKKIQETAQQINSDIELIENKTIKAVQSEDQISIINTVD